MTPDTRSVYFAYSRLDYGTKQAAEAIRDIKAFFGCEVWNPAVDAVNPRDHDVYKAAVLAARALVVMEHDGALGRGAASNVEEALTAKIPVYAYQGGAFHRVKEMVPHPAKDWRGAWAVLGVEKEPTKKPEVV